MRRNITIVAVAVVVIGLLVLGYFVFFANKGAALTSSTSTGNPFGNPAGQGTDTGTAAGEPDSGDNTPTTVAARLVEITPGPVAKGFAEMNINGAVDATASGTPATPDTEVRYVKRESGNIFSYLANAQTITRLSNRTVPGIQEASWLPDGSTAFVRYMSTDDDQSQHIETYALPANGDSGYFLERDLSQALVAGSSTVFTLLPSTSGSVGAFSSPDGSKSRTIFSSLLSDITAFAPNASTLVAETKPSYQSAGYVFTINTSTGAFTQVAGPTTGLEVLPNPTGTQLLMTSVDSSGMHMVLLDLATHAYTSLPLATLAEKCVWARDGSSVYCGVPTAYSGTTVPDGWFQGIGSFTDQIWRVDLTARVATLVADLPALTSSPIDAVSLTIDPHASTLVFMNERNGSLWAYTL